MKRQKVLIIKTGYAEILDKENDSRTVSLGDVLRTTTLLNLYKKSHVIWVTDKEAYPLLKGSPYIDRLWDLRDILNIKQLERERFDTLINLEKIPGICALAEGINAWRKFGFRFDSETGNAKAYDGAFEVLAVGSEPKHKKENKKTAQKLLFEMVGEEWKGEDYVLGYQPKTQEIYDVGLNPVIGTKWPLKSWSMKNWDELEQKLKKAGFKVSRQDKQPKEVLENLEKYMDWINSSKLIITPDSLGMHIALALKKKVIVLFGPTPYKEVEFYGRGEVILPEPIPDCMPCFKTKCQRKRGCMEDISPEKVYKRVIENINQKLAEGQEVRHFRFNELREIKLSPSKRDFITKNKEILGI